MEVETITHILIYLFSFLGLAWIPKSLGTARWIFPCWFLIVNCYLFSSAWKYNINGKPWLFVLPNQLGWILISTWFLVKTNRGQLLIHNSEWVKWQTFRIMSIQYLFLLYAYILPVQFILEVSFLEVIIALTAWPIAYSLKKGGALPKFLFVGWNILGFISLWKFNLTLSTHMLKNPPDSFSLEIASYFTRFPEIWIPTFWIPMGITAHIVMLSNVMAGRKLSPLST